MSHAEIRVTLRRKLNVTYGIRVTLRREFVTLRWRIRDTKTENCDIVIREILRNPKTLRNKFVTSRRSL